MLLRQTLRSLRRAPVYATTVVLTLTLGLASLGAMFAVVHGVRFAPLPHAEPDQLVNLSLVLADGSRIGHAPAVQATWRQHASQLDGVGLYRVGRANVAAGGGDAGVDNLPVSWISASLMPVLRAAPLFGRGFTDDEDRRSGPQAVILSEPEWRARFDGSPDVLGRTLVVNDVVREIVGVMPAAFAFPDASVRMWLPAKGSDAKTAGDFFYSAVARLVPGATMDAARKELETVLPRMAEAYPQLASGGSTATWIAETRPMPQVRSLRDAMTADVAPTLYLLAVVAALVLLVAWTNVIGLALVRADARRRDVAVREALGANRLQASVHAFAETLVLATLAAVLAVAVAAVALWALRTFGPANLPRLTELSIGPGSAALIFGLAVLGSIAVLAPLARVGGLALRLRSGTSWQSPGPGRQRLRSAALALQIAVALVVLLGSALLLRTVQRLHDVRPGFEAAGVTTFELLLPFARYPEAARVAFHARLLERVRALPAVESAALVARLPLTAGGVPQQVYRIDGSGDARTLPTNVASDGYPAAMQIPLLAGRDFRIGAAQRADELLINRRAALELFADATGSRAVGRTLALDPGGPVYTVVGVVGDVRHEHLAMPAPAMVFRPQVAAAVPESHPGPLPGMTLVVRAAGATDPLVTAVRDLVRELDPGVPVYDARAMSVVVAQSMARLNLMLGVLTVAAVVTVGLGMIGLYGLLAYRVALRSREFGVRMALGADTARIAWAVLARGLGLAAAGGLAGLVLYALVAGPLQAAVPGLQAWDPVALVCSLFVLAAMTAIASWAPARRAAAVDPALAMRAD